VKYTVRYYYQFEEVVMEIWCLKGKGNLYWDRGFTYRDVFLVKQPDGCYFLYLKKNGKQVSLGCMDTTWCFFDRDIYVLPASEIRRYKKLLKKEVEMNDEMVQIEKLEKELARLKEIVETKKEKIIYDGDNLYVGIDMAGEPYLLVGKGDYFRFHTLSDVEIGWEDPLPSGQKAIDSAVDERPSLTIYEFSDALEGMEFFMDKYRKYHKED